MLLITALVMIAITIVIHGVGTTQWLRHLAKQGRLRMRPMTSHTRFVVIIQSALVMVCLHLIEILLWAFAYVVVTEGELESFEAAVYFSAVTFTTLGYGDITLSSDWRLLSGFEAINGIVLVGWTTAFLFAVLQRSWTSPDISSEGGRNND